MANIAKNAILRAKVEGVVTDLMIRSNVENVYYNDTTTLATKLAEIIADVATKASATDLTNGLAAKAEKVHTHEQADVNGLVDALAAKASTESMNAAILALKQELLGDTPVEAYNTFTELAEYISTHEEAADALTEAIGTKADKSTVEAIQQTLAGLGALATKSKVAEADLDSALAEKVNAAAEGNHAHANKTVLDGITAEKVAAWDAAEQNAKDQAASLNSAMNTRVAALEADTHTHANKDVIDGITAANIASWNGKAKVYGAAETVNTAEGEIFVQLV